LNLIYLEISEQTFFLQIGETKWTPGPTLNIARKGLGCGIIDWLNPSSNQLEKVVLNRKVKILLNQDSDKKTDSSLPDDTFDIKAGIDKLYLEFKNESKILESLIDLLINHFSIELLQQYYSESENVKSNTNKFIEEYINR
jgi:hypothetical protein